MKLVRRLSRFSLVSILVCGAAVALTAGTAAAASAPTIVKAVMVAPNGSQQVSKIVLTYSKAVTFSKEKTGPFPFSVEGYVVTSVSAAKQTKIVVKLAARSTSDLTVTPFVTYTVPGTNQVKSTKGVPAADQTFIETIAVAPASAVYVATTGNDTNPGTEASPMATIQAAIAISAAAETTIPDVYVSAGTYTEPSTLSLATGVDIDGGYTPGTWTRSLTAVTTIEDTPTAVTADDVTGVTLQLLSISALPNAVVGSSIYGLREVDSNVSLEWVSVTTAAANAGTSGSNGTNGTNGGNGANGANGGRGGTGVFDGGAGGAPVSGDTNGNAGQNGSGPAPGSGGEGTSSAGTLCGPPGVNAPSDATPGGSGTNGLNGSAGAPGTPGPSWNAGFGLNGTSGTSGSGGGGGGSGSGDVTAGGQFCTDPINDFGGGGGGGGAGGGGGIAGTAGINGGGSFGIYLWGSVVSVDANCTISAGNGGAGGAGGNGGLAGSSGTGGAPQTGQGGTAGAGAPGASGGAGGNAGSGSGGQGGPSFGVLEADSSSATIASGAMVSFGTGGPGGAGGSNSQLGQAPSGGTGTAEAVATF